MRKSVNLFPFRTPQSNALNLVTQNSYDIRKLQPSDNFDEFFLGDDGRLNALERFFKKDSKKDQEQLISQSYVFADGGYVRGCVTLVCAEILGPYITQVSQDKEVRRLPYRSLPAVRIARLGVGEKYRNKKIGTRLVAFSIACSQRIANTIGCRFIVVDANRPVVGFYRKFGFEVIDALKDTQRDTVCMYIDLKGVIES